MSMAPPSWMQGFFLELVSQWLRLRELMRSRYHKMLCCVRFQYTTVQEVQGGKPTWSPHERRGQTVFEDGLKLTF